MSKAKYQIGDWVEVWVEWGKPLQKVWYGEGQKPAKTQVFQIVAKDGAHFVLKINKPKFYGWTACEYSLT